MTLQEFLQDTNSFPGAVATLQYAFGGKNNAQAYNNKFVFHFYKILHIL